MKFKQLQDGEWVQPQRRGYKLICCDCGLMHKLDFKIIRGHIQFRAFRDNRGTGQTRRYLRGKV